MDPDTVCCTFYGELKENLAVAFHLTCRFRITKEVFEVYHVLF